MQTVTIHKFPVWADDDMKRSQQERSKTWMSDATRFLQQIPNASHYKSYWKEQFHSAKVKSSPSKGVAHTWKPTTSTSWSWPWFPFLKGGLQSRPIRKHDSCVLEHTSHSSYGRPCDHLSTITEGPHHFPCILLLWQWYVPHSGCGMIDALPTCHQNPLPCMMRLFREWLSI